MRGRAPWLPPALGALLCVAGAVLFARAQTTAPDAGSFAYAPPGVDIAYDSDLLLSFDEPWPLLWTGGHLLGVGLLVAGLLVLGGWAGRLLARRWGVPGRPAVVALGALAGLLVVGGAVLVLTGDAPAVVTYGGSYEPMSGVDASGSLPGYSPVRVSGVQLTGLGTAVLGAVLAAALGAAAVAGVPPGPAVSGPGRAAGWVAVGAGALLAVAGLLLASRAPAVRPELVFLSPEQYDQLVDAAWLADVARVLVAGGVLLAAAAAPWLLGGHGPARARTVAGAALGAAVGLTVLGAVLLWSAHEAQRAVGGVVPGRLVGPGLWVGVVVVLVAGALLGAGVRRVTRRRPGH